MARNLSKPWLRGLLSDSSTVLNTELKDVGRAQIFRLGADPNVSCEISDGEDFIVAAFTKKAANSFEQKHDRGLLTASGAAIHVKSYSLRCHLPHPPSSRSFCPNPNNGMCPKSLCASNHPQFWILISGLAYLGGDGNSVFGEPVNVNLRDAVSFKLARLSEAAVKATEAVNEPGSAKRVAATAIESLGKAGSEKQTRKRRKSCASDAASRSPPPVTAPKGSKRASGRAIALPALGDVPFIDDMKSAWECQSMWSFLAIQQAAVPFMPIHGLPKPHHQRLSQNEMEQQPSSSAITHVSESPARSALSQHLPLPSPPAPPAPSEDNLNGLLISVASQAIPASVMMDQLYGASYDDEKSRMDTDESEDGRSPSGEVLAQFWDQPAPFALLSSQLNP
ncbi:hypothetical protein H4S07_002819 [Coemansia furcata]|uniref:Uncharacterized protein n=1 Tax=Coemansia furcata TaxID=417177 RepID=A0ACC1LII2_9FUNG|nr:hypothetical protein H4S07_002819 [Coemansia furcata]